MKKDVRGDEESHENIELTVALPFSLSIEPPFPVIDKNLNETLEEVVCQATGAGGVDPTLIWQIDGISVESQFTEPWQVREIKFFSS